MEIILVLGENESGKSLYAETIAMECGEDRFYLATMIPYTDDNYRRIEKHRIQRKDKGFTTIEIPWDIQNNPVTKDSVVLLEDASNLLANGIFQYNSNAIQTYQAILSLASQCKTLIIVSINGLTDDSYDKETANYIQQLNWLNKQLYSIANSVFLMKNGHPVCHK